MSAAQPTVWMNVTTSASWNRPAVGIVRVEQSISAELAQLCGANFRRCIWHDGQFVEWRPDRELELQRVSAPSVANAVASKRAVTLPMMFQLLPKRQALKNIAQGLLSLMPNKLRPHFNRLLYSAAPRLKRILSSGLVGQIKRRLQMFSLGGAANRAVGQKKKTADRLIFKENDVLISLGLDWDFDYYKDFYHLRTQHKIKVVTCCYDLIPVLYPQYCVGNVSNKFTSYFLDVADGSDLVLCISKQSERDLNQVLESTGGARPPTFVFTLGDRVSQKNTGTLSAEVSGVCQGKFILFVSTIERRKNHEVLYRAYHLLCRQGKGAGLPKLVFVGMAGWGTAELLKDIELDPQTQDLIVQLNHVSDYELEHLYKTSLFCVFPSLYEGWGLPVAEALCFGKVVVCSDQGSLPEVGGDLVEYVRPWDTQAWADKIYLLSTVDAKRVEIEDRVKNNYRPRSWSSAAGEIKNKIDELN